MKVPTGSRAVISSGSLTPPRRPAGRVGRDRLAEAEDVMPEASEYARGVPCWIELSCTDINASKEVYSALFGWESFVGPPESGHYTQALLDGKSVAGLLPQADTP